MKGHVKFVRNYEKGSDADAVYDVLDKHDDELGDISFYTPWKKWIFSAGGSFFDTKCLKKIVEFMENLNY